MCFFDLIFEHSWLSCYFPAHEESGYPEPQLPGMFNCVAGGIRNVTHPVAEVLVDAAMEFIFFPWGMVKKLSNIPLLSRIQTLLLQGTAG